MKRWILISALILLPLMAGAQSVQSLESRRAQIEKEIALLGRKIDDNSKSSSRLLNGLTLVRRKISAREELIASYDKSIGMLDDSIRIVKKEIDVLQRREDTLSKYYARLVKGAYKNRDNRVWYMYLLASESLGQAYNRFGYLRNLSSQMNTQAKHLKEVRADLDVKKERLEGLRKQAAAMRQKVVTERTKLRSEESESARMMNQLKKDRKTYEKQLREKNRQKEELNRKIAELISKETGSSGKGGKSSSKAKTTSTVIDTKLSGEFAANKGRLPWPVEGTVVERFGKHAHPVYTNVQLPQNNGVTLVVKRDAQAKAVFDGTVTRIVVLPGYNQCVLVSHGEYFTLYSKLKAVSVKAGDKIKTGDVVGVVDNIGGEDQFHFELWKGSSPQNPENWLKK